MARSETFYVVCAAQCGSMRASVRFDPNFVRVEKSVFVCLCCWGFSRRTVRPNGMNKLIVNHLEKIFVTSDCMTILSESEIQHPAAKMVPSCFACSLSSHLHS